MVAIGGRAGGVGRLVIAALAAAAMVTGAVWFVGSSVLHDRVLDRRTYLDAFDEVDAYGRLYTDVLTDGPVRDATDRLFDGLAQLGVDRQDGSAVANAALRLTLPPAVLREVAQAFVAGLLAYLRDDSGNFEAFVPLDEILAHIDPAASELVEQAVIALSQLLADHVDDIESFIRAAFDALADGEIPVMVPVVGGRKVAEDQLIAVLDGLPGALLPADVLDDLLAALDSSEHRDAFIARALGSVRSSLQDLGHQLATDDVEIDLIRVLVAVTGRDRAEVIAEAAHAKQGMAWAPSWSRYVGLGMFLVGGAGLCRRRRRRAPRAVSLGVGVAAAGGAVSASWFVLSTLIGSPLSAITHSANHQAVPDGAARLLADLDDVLLRELSGAWMQPATVLVICGAGCVVGGLSMQLWTHLAVRGRRRFAGALAVIVTSGVLAVPAPRGVARAQRLCNGHAELCDRHYDEVVQAATHNSMSSPDVVRVWPEHDGSIGQQLQSGVRTLMIDASYWPGVNDTHLEDLRDLLGAGDTSTLIDTIEARLAPCPGVFLCHNVCALGALPMTTALAQLRSFLDDHPDDVVTLMIQDSIDPVDAEAAFRDAGLDGLLYDGSADAEWPTLGELIDRHQRLIVFSEQHGSPGAWYQSAFEHIQDTPYGARSADQLTCARGRGPRDAPLLLLNNWVQREAPDRAQAAIVNSRSFIVDRARRCAEQRGRLPNFIAVSFYGIGDVMGAVDELNGVATR